MKVIENNLKNDMEDLNINDTMAGAESQAAAEAANKSGHKMKCGGRRHRFHGGHPEGENWQNIRRQRMMMRKARANNGGSDTPQWGFPGMMPPTMMFGHPGFHQHQHRHQNRRWFGHPHQMNPMMYFGPQYNQFEGDFAGPMFAGPHSRGPMFHPGLMPMMMAMSGGPMFMGKRKCKENKETEGREESSKCEPGKGGTVESGLPEGMPPFMMPWMFKHYNFRKFMNKESMGTPHHKSCKTNQEKKPDSETDNPAGEQDMGKDSGHENLGHRKKQHMKIMRKMMAMNMLNGGFPPMGMYQGTMYPADMEKFMQRKKRRCQRKKKNESGESCDDSPLSCDDAEALPDDDIQRKSDADILVESAENMDHCGAPCESEGLENSDKDEESKECSKKRRGHHGHHRRWMRSMIMNGGFPPMWFMMQHQKGFPHMSPHLEVPIATTDQDTVDKDVKL